MGGMFDRYSEKVLSVEPANLIGCWLQDERSGTVSYDRSGQGNDGAYVGATLGQPGVPGMGMTSPFFDGINDYNNIHSAGLVADFDGAEGTLLSWISPVNAAMWTDTVLRRPFILRADDQNRIYLQSVGNGTLNLIYEGGDVVEFYNPPSWTGWLAIGITWDAAGDAVEFYRGGLNPASAVGLGVWAGNLNPASAVIGAGSTGPAQLWHGWIGPTMLWNAVLTPAQVAYLSKV